jgi:hypothetical protein
MSQPGANARSAFDLALYAIARATLLCFKKMLYVSYFADAVAVADEDEDEAEDEFEDEDEPDAPSDAPAGAAAGGGTGSCQPFFGFIAA